MSEFAFDAPPRPSHFPQRNRLVASLSRATVVVQAQRRSGSMITARLAAQMGREVFAVPGLPGDPLAAGSHELLRQGAALLEDARDIWREFGIAELI
jgi:DNA processing protein